MFLQETRCNDFNESDWCRRGRVFLSHGTALSAGVEILFSRSLNHFKQGQIRKRVVQLYTSLYENDFGLQEDQPPAGAPVDSTGAAPGPTDNPGLKGAGHRWTIHGVLQGLLSSRHLLHILSQDILEVFNESLATSSLPLSCSRTVITLLPKKGK